MLARLQAAVEHERRFAAAGYLPPVEGALLQEAIDVAVILNALRALRGWKLYLAFFNDRSRAVPK